MYHVGALFRPKPIVHSKLYKALFTVVFDSEIDPCFINNVDDFNGLMDGTTYACDHPYMISRVNVLAYPEPAMMSPFVWSNAIDAANPFFSFEQKRRLCVDDSYPLFTPDAPFWAVKEALDSSDVTVVDNYKAETKISQENYEQLSEEDRQSLHKFYHQNDYKIVYNKTAKSRYLEFLE